MRILKWFLGGLSLLAVLVMMILLYLTFTFDPSDYKKTIIDRVKIETGRDITINGELSLSFYPWIGVSVSDVKLANAEGFAAEHFGQFDFASARLKLLPLLQKQIQIDQVELSDAEIWLARDAKGVTNWDDVLERFDQGASGDLVDTRSSPLERTNIAGVTIKNATLHWDDLTSGDSVSFTSLNLATGALALNKETSIKTDFNFALKKPLIQGQVKLLARTPLSLQAPYILQQPNLEMSLQGIDLQAENIQANIVGDELKFSDGRIAFKKPNITYAIKNMPSLGAEIKGTLLGDTLSVDAGDLQWSNVVLKSSITGSALPGDTAEFEINSDTMSLVNKTLRLQNASLLTKFTGQPWPQGQQVINANLPELSYHTIKNNLSIPEIKVQALGLDLFAAVQAQEVTTDITANGTIKVADFVLKDLAKTIEVELPSMSDEAWQSASLTGNYAVTKNSLGLTNLRASIDGTEWLGQAAIVDLNNKKLSFNLAAESLDLNRLLPPEQAAALQDNKNAKSNEEVNAITLPTEALRIWDAEGTLSLGSLTIGNVVSQNLKTRISLQDGVLNFPNNSMDIFGGKNAGTWTYDASGDIPSLQGKEQFSSLDLSLVEQSLWEKKYVSGSATGNATVKTSGITVGAMRSNLNGDLDLNVDQGVLHGFDINYVVANAVSVAKQKTLAADVPDTKKTPFNQLSASGKIENGVLKNDDFLAELPRMRIRGNGSVSLIESTINYKVNTDILESKSATLDKLVDENLDELVGASIPVKITGPMEEPKITLDVAGFLKNKYIDEAKDSVKDKLGETLKDKVGGDLGGLLGGLLGQKEESKDAESTEKIKPEIDSEVGADSATDKKLTEEDLAEGNTEEGKENPDVTVSEEGSENSERELTPEEKRQQEEEVLKKKAKDKLKDLFGG